MTPETRTSHGIAKTVLLWQGRSQDLDLTVEEVHGRVSLRRSIDRRHITTDALEPDEADHLAACLTEQSQRARAQRRSA